MSRTAELASRLKSMAELLDVVGALRALAGVRLQEAQAALAGVRRYSDISARAVGGALGLAATPPAPELEAADGGPAAQLLFLSEHGFVGGLNERVIAAVRPQCQPGDRLFVLGRRGAGVMAEHWRSADWTGPMATFHGGVTASVRGLALILISDLEARRIRRVQAHYVRVEPGTTSRVVSRLLFPLDRRRLPQPPPAFAPVTQIPPARLAERLTGEYLFAQLTEAAVEALAGENSARFGVMAAAHDQLSHSQEKLTREARLARQADITAELLELIAGSGALARG